MFDEPLNGLQLHVCLMRTQCHPDPQVEAGTASLRKRSTGGGSSRGEGRGWAQDRPGTPGAPVGPAALPRPSLGVPGRSKKGVIHAHLFVIKCIQVI